MQEVLVQLQSYIGKVLEIDDGKNIYRGQINCVEMVNDLFLKVEFLELLWNQPSFGWMRSTIGPFVIATTRVQWLKDKDQKITGFSYDHQTCRFLQPSAMNVV